VYFIIDCPDRKFSPIFMSRVFEDHWTCTFRSCFRTAKVNFLNFFIITQPLRVGTSYRTHHKQLHKLTQAIVRKSSYECKNNRTTDEKAPSYRTSTMARTTKFRTMAEICTMNRRTFIVRHVLRRVIRNVVVCS
jgi:hypothetical protein